jgi:hypothetical protein
MSTSQSFNVKPLAKSKESNRIQALEWFLSLPQQTFAANKHELYRETSLKTTGVVSRLADVFLAIVDDCGGFVESAVTFLEAILTQPDTLTAINTDTMIWSYDGETIRGEPLDFDLEFDFDDFYFDFEAERIEVEDAKVEDAGETESRSWFGSMLDLVAKVL